MEARPVNAILLAVSLLASFIAKEGVEARCSKEVVVSKDELQCGQSIQLLSQQRIIGGSGAAPGEFPYIVAIKYKDQYMCGGSIISNKHILLAAHCIESKEPKDYEIVIGAFKRHSNVDECRTRRSVAKIFVHEKYESAKKDAISQFDIAIFRVSKPITFKLTADGYGSANRVCLPRLGKRLKIGQSVTLSGWGYMRQKYFETKEGFCDRRSEKRDQANEMQVAHFQIVPNEQCIPKLSQFQFCINSFLTFTPGAGDSGSPYVEFIAGRAYQVGIVSGQDGSTESHCKRITAYATRVTQFVDWIKNIINRV